MKSVNWKGILELIGIAAIVASLVFLALQIKQTDDVARTEIFIAYAEARNDYEALLIENAEIWQKACTGEELAPADQFRAAQIYEAFVNTSYVGWQAARIGLALTSTDERVNAFAANMHRYPGFRAIDESHLIWTDLGSANSTEDTALFGNAIDARLRYLQEIEPVPLSDPTWCGHL